MTAPAYWATAERTNSASGWAVFSQPVSGPDRPRGDSVNEVTQSKSSGSVWAISSHSGWKLNHPAAWKAVLSRV